jgi:surfactin synthase thioesterase subunit
VTGPWIADDVRAPVPATATWQLFCFAHAGGGPLFFRSWRSALAPDIAVRPVLLPGRERRLAETPYRQVAPLLNPLCAGLAPHLRPPYAFFGHSMGAVVAYEAARRLAATPAGGPACLVVSGRPAPGRGRDRGLARLPDAEFTEVVGRLNGTPPEILAEPDLMSLLLPGLRADFELAETYQPLPGARLACRVAAYLGADDPDVSRADMLAWRDVTSGPFTMRVFRGDHFYLREGPADVLTALRSDLSDHE